MSSASGYTATLVAGTKTYYKVKGAAGDMLLLNGVTNLGDIGSTGAFEETTTIADTTRTYIGGLKDPNENTLTVNIYSSDNNQQAFLKAAQESRSVEMKAVFPPDATGKQMVIQFDMALSGYSVPQGNVQQFNISGRISGEPSVVFVTAGKVYGISALTITTAGTFSLSDGDYTLTQGKEFTTTGGGVGAVVSVTISSNTISAVANIVDPGVGFEQSDTLNITHIGGVSGSAQLTVSSVS